MIFFNFSPRWNQRTSSFTLVFFLATDLRSGTWVLSHGVVSFWGIFFNYCQAWRHFYIYPCALLKCQSFKFLLSYQPKLRDCTVAKDLPLAKLCILFHKLFQSSVKGVTLFCLKTKDTWGKPFCLISSHLGFTRQGSDFSSTLFPGRWNHGAVYL